MNKSFEELLFKKLTFKTQIVYILGVTDKYLVFHIIGKGYYDNRTIRIDEKRYYYNWFSKVQKIESFTINDLSTLMKISYCKTYSDKINDIHILIQKKIRILYKIKILNSEKV